MRGLALSLLLTTFVFGESASTAPTFDIADVHVSVKATNMFFRPLPARGGRYELRTATMVDLIRTAYGFDADKVLGGPSWLELDRFDVIAKVAAGSTIEDHKVMLQALLKERFGLAT